MSYRLGPFPLPLFSLASRFLSLSNCTNNAPLLIQQPTQTEYASSARAGCKGPMPCKGNKIDKGTLRVGTMVTIQERQTMSWRHWGCVTPKIISNWHNALNGPDDIDGFEDLREVDQERVKTAWEEGHVADEDIPDTARKPAPENGEEGSDAPPKKKRAPAKKAPPKKKNSDEENGAAEEAEEEEKPKRKRAAPKKKKVESDEEAEEEVEKPKRKRAPPKKKVESEEEEEEEEEKPKPKAAKKGKTAAPAAKKFKKVESEEEEEEDEEKSESDDDGGAPQVKITYKKKAPAAKKGRKAKAAASDDE